MNPTLSVIALFVLAADSSILKNELPISKWECENICAGGPFEYNPVKNICKCIIKQNKGLWKREVENNFLATTEPQKTVTESPTLEVTLPVIDEEVVGQALNSQLPLHRRIADQRRQNPLTSDQQKFIMQQMRQHLNRLSVTTDQRIRQYEIDAIRNNLKQLSQGLFQMPQIRSRLAPDRDRVKNIVQQARRQHRLPLLPGSLRLGAKKSSEDNGGSENEEVGAAVKEIFKKPKKFEIITQNPKLVDTDEEDN